MTGIFRSAEELRRDHRREARRRREYIVDELGLDPALVAKLGVEGARAEMKRREKIRAAKREAAEMRRWRAELLRREQEQAELYRVLARERRTAAARKGWKTRRDRKQEADIWKTIIPA